MAELAEPILSFEGGCPDCGERRAVLPMPLPGIADDFDCRCASDADCSGGQFCYTPHGVFLRHPLR